MKKFFRTLILIFIIALVFYFISGSVVIYSFSYIIHMPLWVLLELCLIIVLLYAILRPAVLAPTAFLKLLSQGKIFRQQYREEREDLLALADLFSKGDISPIRRKLYIEKNKFNLLFRQICLAATLENTDQFSSFMSQARRYYFKHSESLLLCEIAVYMQRKLYRNAEMLLISIDKRMRNIRYGKMAYKLALQSATLSLLESYHSLWINHRMQLPLCVFERLLKAASTKAQVDELGQLAKRLLTPNHYNHFIRNYLLQLDSLGYFNKKPELALDYLYEEYYIDIVSSILIAHAPLTEDIYLTYIRKTKSYKHNNTLLWRLRLAIHQKDQLSITQLSAIIDNTRKHILAMRIKLLMHLQHDQKTLDYDKETVMMLLRQTHTQN